MGLLNDWELSKLAGGDQVARQPDHMVRLYFALELSRRSHVGDKGTWQFMSVMVLSDFTWKMDTPDDLESLLYVILWHSIRYLPHNCPNVGPLMFKLFDESDRYGASRLSAATFVQAQNRGWIHKCLSARKP